MRVLLIALLAAISYAQTEDLFHIYGDCDFEDGCIGSKNRSHALMRAQKEECCIVTFKHDVQLYFFSYFDIHSDDRLTIRGKDVHSSDEVPMSLCKGETLVWRKKTSHATEGWEMCFETYENAICDAPDEAISETICEMTQAQTANGNINAVIFILILAAIITIIIAFCIWIWIEKCTKKKEGESFLLKSKDSLSVFGKGNFPSGPEQILIFDVPYPAAEAPYSPIENEREREGHTATTQHEGDPETTQNEGDPEASEDVNTDGEVLETRQLQARYSISAPTRKLKATYSIDQSPARTLKATYSIRPEPKPVKSNPFTCDHHRATYSVRL